MSIEDDRQRRIYLDMMAGKYPAPKKPCWMSGFAFDANIVIDALTGFEPARDEILRALEFGSRAWISRMVWIEVMSKGSAEALRRAELMLSGFGNRRNRRGNRGAGCGFAAGAPTPEVARRYHPGERDGPRPRSRHPQYQGLPGQHAGNSRSLYSLRGTRAMCGIIGIVGKEEVADRLVDGLRRMEYRGYDSAGIALCTAAS